MVMMLFSLYHNYHNIDTVQASSSSSSHSDADSVIVSREYRREGEVGGREVGGREGGEVIRLFRGWPNLHHISIPALCPAQCSAGRNKTAFNVNI